MTPRTSARIAGWGGVLFALLSGVILVLAPFWPPLGASALEVVTFYRAHRLPFLIGNYLAVIAAVPSFTLIGYLVTELKRAEPPTSYWWVCVLGTGVMGHAVGASVLITYQAVPFQLDPGQEAVAKGLSDLAGVGFALFQGVLVAQIISLTLGLRATSLFPRWVSSLGIPVAILATIGSFGSVTATPPLAGGGIISCLAVGAFVGWMFLISVLVLKNAAPSVPAAR